MKSFYKVVFVIIILSVSLSLFGGEENHPYDRPMMWYKSKDVNEHSKYAVQEYADIKQDIVNYFLYNANENNGNNFKNDYDNKITEKLWLNSNFYGYSEEQNYYFAEKDENGNLNYGNYDSNEDYSCAKQIILNNGFNYETYCQALKWVSVELGSYAEIELKVIFELIFDSNSNIVKKYDDNFKDKFVRTITVYGYGYPIPAGILNVPYTGDWKELNIDFTNNTNNPHINNRIYDFQCGRYFSIHKSWDDRTLKGSWGNRVFDWKGGTENIKYYYAKSPLPYIIGEKIFTKHFDATEDTIPHNNKIYDTDIRTDYHVKVLYARFYKYDEIENKWKYDYEDNPDIVNIMGEYEDGIDKLKITENVIGIENKKRFQNDGKYMMILSSIDKFNKIFLFEPEYFIIDKSSPTVTGETVDNDDFFTTTTGNPIIVDFNGAEIKDNVLNFNEIISNNQLDQYIYIKKKYVTDPILLADSDDFKLEDNKIKLEIQDEYVYVEKIYIQDKAGNESRAIVEDQTYAWDKTAPRVRVSNLNGTYLTSKQNLYLDIIEEFGVDIKKIQVELRGESGTISTDYHYYPSMNNDLLIVELNKFNGKEEELELILTLTDLAGNERLYKDNELLFDYDDKAPVIITATVNGDPLYNYYIKAINTDGKINIVSSDLNFDKVILDFSAYGTRDNIILKSKDVEYTLSKLDGIDNEKFTIRIIDLAGNETELENICLSFSDDDDAPIFVNASQDIDNKWRYDLEAFDKGSYIKYVYYKEIETNADKVVINDFGILPSIDSNTTYNGWNRIAENIKVYKSEVDILPGWAVCFILIDGWGNVSEGLILRNKTVEFYEVYNKQDLINANWDLSGDVVIYDNLTIDAGETLLIRSTSDKGPATIRFSSENDKKIKIINNGTIDIDTEYGNVVFTSLNESNEDYSWFGIINETGTLNIDKINNRTVFKNAISPIVYENPPSIVSLGMIDFVNCKMGIHFIDDANDYSPLEISNINFTSLIYGIKFDLLDINNKGIYSGAKSYLEATGSITKDDIIRSDIYCPVFGLLEFENVNNAPEVLNVNIIGTLAYNQQLEIVYEFYDSDNGDMIDETQIYYQWYYSNNMQGPYTPIEDAIAKTWIVPGGYGGKWIKARVIVTDNNNGKSLPGYSKPNPMDNKKPEALDVTVKADPDRASGFINIRDTIIADFTFRDEDGNDEGDHIYKWFVSDTYSYLEIENAPHRTTKSWIIDESIEGKFVYFTVEPVDNGGAIGLLQRSNIVEIQNLGIPTIEGNITLVKETINGYESLVGEFEVDTTNTTGSIDNFIYKWFKIDNNNNRTEILGFKNTLQILDDFEGCNIELEITPRNEDEEVGPSTTSLPHPIPYIPPAIASIKVECMTPQDLTWDVINEDPALPIPGNKFVVTAVPEIKEGFDVYIEYEWYINDGNSFVKIDGEVGKELIIKEEWLKRTIEVKAKPFIITYDHNKVMEIVYGDETNDFMKTCKLVDLNIKPDDNTSDFVIIDSETNKIKYLYNTDADSGNYKDIQFKNYVDLNKNELINGNFIVKVEMQGAGAGGGGGGDSVFIDGCAPGNIDFCRVAGGGGGGGSAGEYKIEENISLSFDDACTINVGKGGEGSTGNGDDGENTTFSGNDILGESIPLSCEGGNRGTKGSLEYTLYNAPYTGLVVAQRILIHGEGGINPSGIPEHNGQNAYDPDLENIRNGGTGGNGGSVNGDVINGGYCKINDDNGNAHYGYPGEDAEINSGNGGGGGGGAGYHQTTSSGNGTHDGAKGGNGGHGYVIIELSGTMYTTDWE